MTKTQCSSNVSASTAARIWSSNGPLRGRKRATSRSAISLDVATKIKLSMRCVSPWLCLLGQFPAPAKAHPTRDGPPLVGILRRESRKPLRRGDLPLLDVGPRSFIADFQLQHGMPLTPFVRAYQHSEERFRLIAQIP